MNIQDQSINAIDFTQKLAKYIVNANNKTLNKDEDIVATSKQTYCRQ